MIAVLALSLWAGEYPRTADAWLGKTPKLDGRIAKGEYADATPITGVLDWIPQFSKTTDPKDLALKGWVKQAPAVLRVRDHRRRAVWHRHAALAAWGEREGA